MSIVPNYSIHPVHSSFYLSSLDLALCPIIEEIVANKLDLVLVLIRLLV